ncbi:MAG: hypothetical protein H0T76_13510 [Nannocystis sp.]|nr:hypothetical protein [Nannocystis sp.]MBA3547499.1 hypothetical protein [Nannocystis sp.]
MHLTTPAVPFLLALAMPFAAQAADTRAQPEADDVVDTTPIVDTTPTDPTVIDPGAVTTVTRTEVAVVPVEVVREEADIGRIEGRHRIHIESDAFSWRRWTPWEKDDMNNAGEQPRSSTDSLNILGGAPVFGVPGAGPAGNVTFGWGYGIRERVVLGARLGVGWQQFTQPDQEKAANRAVAYNFTPYVEFVFRPGMKVRPYLGARVGLGGSSFAKVMGDVTQRVSTIGPIFGASAGLHAFLTERVSFDAALAFDYALAFGRTKMTGNNMDQKTDFERTSRMPNVALVVGFSMWLGRDRSERNDDRISRR